MRFLYNFTAECQPITSTFSITTGVVGLSFQSVRSCGDFIHNIHAADNHLAKCSILAIQMRSILVHDEELAAGGVGVIARAMLITPRVCLMGLFTPFCRNSPLMFQPGPPVPLPTGSRPGS